MRAGEHSVVGGTCTEDLKNDYTRTERVEQRSRRRCDTKNRRLHTRTKEGCQLRKGVEGTRGGVNTRRQKDVRGGKTEGQEEL